MYPQLPRPFFTLAPMYDVTDTVFRQIIASLAPADMFFTEFVNVDGLQSSGREQLSKYLRYEPVEKPLIAQIWGSDPDNYRKTADELVTMGFAGIDINMGCPDRKIVKRGCCSGLIGNRDHAVAIIKATREGIAGRIPLSVKTRLGFSDIDYTWHELLLHQDLDMLTIHGRVARQMSRGTANWEAINEIRKMRDQISPNTLIVGNGDVLSRKIALSLASQYELDGIMIGRGVFQNPLIFMDDDTWESYTTLDRLKLYKKHIHLFESTWQHNERPIATLNRFCKIYVNGFEGSKELRESFMKASSVQELLELLAGEITRIELTVTS